MREGAHEVLYSLEREALCVLQMVLQSTGRGDDDVRPF